LILRFEVLVEEFDDSRTNVLDINLDFGLIVSP